MWQRILMSTGVLAFLIASPTWGQESGVSSTYGRQLPPPVHSTPPANPLTERDPISLRQDDAPSEEEVTADVDIIVDSIEPDPLDRFRGYRYQSDATEWIIGDGDQFGMFSFLSDHYEESGVASGLGVGVQFHFLAGPERADMPPRVYDFSLGYQRRDRLGAFGYDVAFSIMASSDFEGSSRDGIRFPGHAVGFMEIGPAAELVLGVDYLDRGNIKLLPVAGLITHPYPNLRLELLFPRPRAVFQLTDRQQLYLGGELGGGTWAVERTSLLDDLVTYEDLRLTVGLQRIKEGHKRSAIEVSYLFNRRLEYTSGIGTFNPIDTAMIRFVQTY